MAAVLNAFTATASSANVTSYASVSFTPTAGDLLVVFCQATDTVAASPTLTASANSLTFTLITSATRNTSAHTQYLFVCDQLVPSSPSAMTLTFDCTGDAATGLIMCGGTVSGMSKSGTAAVLQTATQDNQAGGTTPAPTFSSAVQTGNPTLVGLATTSAAGTTPPTNWTERVDTTYSTPTTGGGYVSRDSGFTGTTITWGSTSTQFCDIAVELDTSASGLTGNASQTVTVTETSTGVVGAVTGAALALTVGLTAGGVVATSTGSAVTENVNATSTGTVGAVGNASQTITIGLSAAGSVTSGLSGGGSLAESVTASASGAVAAFSDASRAITLSFTSAGVVATLGNATTIVTAGRSAAGLVAVFGNSSAPITLTLTASGTVTGAYTAIDMEPVARVLPSARGQVIGSSSGRALQPVHANVAATTTARVLPQETARTEQ